MVRVVVFISQIICLAIFLMAIVVLLCADTEESEYQTDYDEDAVLSDFDLSNPDSEHSEDEEEETADTLDTVRQLAR